MNHVSIALYCWIMVNVYMVGRPNLKREKSNYNKGKVVKLDLFDQIKSIFNLIKFKLC